MLAIQNILQNSNIFDRSRETVLFTPSGDKKVTRFSGSLPTSVSYLNLRRFPNLLFWRETYPQTFSPEFLSICEYNSWTKTACYRSLKNWHFVKVCTEKMMDHQYRENGERNIYSNYNQIMLNALQINQKKVYLIDLFIEQSTKFWGFRNSAGRFCISVLPEYCSSALKAQACKMVITTVCVQIDSCFCNTWIVVH